MLRRTPFSVAILDQCPTPKLFVNVSAAADSSSAIFDTSLSSASLNSTRTREAVLAIGNAARSHPSKAWVVMGISEPISQILGQEVVGGITEKARVDSKNDATGGPLMSRPKLGAGARSDATSIGHGREKMDDDEKYYDA
jgi:hypothetical protein